MKKQTFIITLSKVFLQGHPKAGQETNFKESFLNGTKIHTIRSNYDYWKPIIDKVNLGKAILSVRQWSGKPYSSKQELLKNIEGGLGIQNIYFIKDKVYSEFYNLHEHESDSNLLAYIVHDEETHDIAKNDGFINNFDFINWFPEEINNGCIIHFTDYRY